jgi:hypothetical protein
MRDNGQESIFVKFIYNIVSSALSSLATGTSSVISEIESRVGLYRSVLFILIAVWGLWLISPLWATFDSTPTYRIMSAFAGEEVWGVVLAATGIVGLASTIGGMMRVSQNLMLMSAVLWFTISGTFMASNFFSTASVVYPTLALLCCINYYLIEVKGALSNE